MRAEFLLISALCALPLPVLADIGEAQVFVNDASAKFRQGDFEGALVALRKAEPLALAANDPSLAQIRFNIARCLEELKQDREALEAYESYLKLPDQAHRKERAVAAMSAIRKRIFGGLAISCEPSGASVRIDRQTAVPCPVRLDAVAPGTLEIEVSYDGYRAVKRTVEVVAGETATSSFRLEPVNGLVVSELEPVQPAESGSAWPWVTLGAGLVLAGGGAFFTFSAIDDRDASEALPPGGDRDELVSGYETSETVSWVLYGAGGAALVAGVLMLLTADGPSAVAPTGNGVMIRW